MKLSKQQIEYINDERQKLIDRYEYKKANNIVEGTLADLDRIRSIQLIIELHNLENKKEEKRDAVFETPIQELGIPAWLLSLPA